jgi:hypothetical protein
MPRRNSSSSGGEHGHELSATCRQPGCRPTDGRRLGADRARIGDPRRKADGSWDGAPSAKSMLVKLSTGRRRRHGRTAAVYGPAAGADLPGMSHRLRVLLATAKGSARDTTRGRHPVAMPNGNGDYATGAVEVLDGADDVQVDDARLVTDSFPAVDHSARLIHVVAGADELAAAENAPNPPRLKAWTGPVWRWRATTPPGSTRISSDQPVAPNRRGRKDLAGADNDGAVLKGPPFGCQPPAPLELRGDDAIPSSSLRTVMHGPLPPPVPEWHNRSPIW